MGPVTGYCNSRHDPVRGELAVVADGKDKAPGDVSAMPGDRFVVKETTPQLAHVVACSAEGKGVLLAVPRRDFELGYVRVLP